MKNLFLIIVIAFISISVNAQIKNANLIASGLTCSMCSNSIFKSLKKISFVETVESDVENSAFKIIFKTDENVDLDALQKAVVGAGFSVAKLTFIINANSLDVKDKSLVEIDGKSFYFVDTKDKTLNGEVELRLLDKEFNSPKEYKKVKKKLYSESETRVYNVSI
jgi:copper chaperone CopZ